MDLNSSLSCQVPTPYINYGEHSCAYINMIGKFLVNSKLERRSLLAKVYWLQTVAGLVN